MNSDTDKARFFHKLMIMTTFHSLHWTDIKRFPSFSLTDVSHSSTASTSWINHIFCSNSNLVSSLETLYAVIPRSNTHFLRAQYSLTSLIYLR